VLALFGATVIAPSLIQAPNADAIGFPWQGRYGLPLGVGVPILAAVAVGASNRLRALGTKRLVGLVVTAVALVHVISHIVSTRRNVVGTNGPLFYLDQHGWDPPLPAWLLLLATVALAGGLAVLTYRVAVSDSVFGRWWPAAEPEAPAKSSPTSLEARADA